MDAQDFVIKWFECAAAASLLLGATWWAVSRLRQPVDRANLILMGLLASVLLPIAFVFFSSPRWHLGLFAARQESVVSASVPLQITQDRSSLPIAVTSVPPSEPSAQCRPAQDDSAQPLAENRTSNVAVEQTIAPNNSSTTDSEVVLPTPSSQAISQASPPAGPNVSWWPIAGVILSASYCLAFLYFLGEWIFGSIRLKKFLQRAKAPTASLWRIWHEVVCSNSKDVRILITNDVTTPLVFGWWRPVILLPQALADGDRLKLRFCLAHEWAHVLAGDLWAWRLTNLCRLVLWYQPLYWTLRRELRICQDLVADDQAVGGRGVTDNHVHYSELLLSLAQQHQATITGAIAFHDRSSQLSRRITMLLTFDQTMRRKSHRSFLSILGCSLLLAVFLLSSFRLSAAIIGDSIHPPERMTGDIGAAMQKPLPIATETREDFRFVQGRVVDEQDQPIPGAEIILPLNFETGYTVKAIADSDGNFELKCPIEQVNGSIRGRSSVAWAYAPGYNMLPTNVYKSLLQGLEEKYIFRLVKEQVATFRIVRPEGQPMSGLTVQTRYIRATHQSAIVPEELQPIVSGVTNDNGDVSFRAVSADLIDMIVMVSEEFGQQEFRMSRRIDTQSNEIRLRPTATIRGKITTENSEWAAGIKLTFATRTYDSVNHPTGRAVVTTDAEGRFEVPKIAIGLSEYVDASFDQEMPVRPLLPAEFELRENETKELEIPLIAAPKVHGRVVSKNNAPVADVGVIVRYGNIQSDLATTDENGRFEARTLPGEFRVTLGAVPQGHASPVHSTDAKPFRIAKDATEFEVPTIQLIGTVEITGQLLDENNRPMPDKIVDALDRNRRYSIGISDAEGKFSITVPEGVQNMVKLQLQDKQSSVGDNLEVIQRDPLIVRYVTNNRENELEAARMAKTDVALIGQVLFKGEPIAGVPIVVERNSPVFRPDGTIEPSSGRTHPGDQVETDVDGKYRLKNLKAGDKYTIYIRPKFAAVDLDWKHYYATVPEDAEAEVTLPDVQLEPLSQSIAGFVVDPDGKPVKGAKIIAQLRGGTRILYDRTRPESTTVGTSDEEGRFQIKELPDRSLSLYAYLDSPARGSSRFPVKLDIERNQQDIRIVLDPSLVDDEE